MGNCPARVSVVAVVGKCRFLTINAVIAE